MIENVQQKMYNRKSSYVKMYDRKCMLKCMTENVFYNVRQKMYVKMYDRKCMLQCMTENVC